jgi:hypothetical protein
MAADVDGRPGGGFGGRRGGVAGNLRPTHAVYRSMRYPLPLLLLPVIAAGCLGSAGGHGARSTTGPASTVTVLPATSLRITYPVGNAVPTRAALAPCPGHASCRVSRLRTQCPATSWGCMPTHFVRVAVRRLTCSPSGGDYPNPGSACRALDDLERRMQSGRAGICSCPMAAYGYRRARAVGSYRHHPVTLALDPCSLCGLGVQAAHDASLLLPQA